MTMSVRAKMRLTSIQQHEWNQGQTKTLRFQCEYDTTTPEDQRFQKATPSGEIQMMVDNPEALKQFELGRHYYVDFSPVPTAEKA
jgi:hypothetical protein